MRALMLLVLALGASSCTRTSAPLILDVRLSRDPGGHVVSEVEIEAVEQGGGAIGPYCVSAHWFPIGGFDPLSEELVHYNGEVDPGAKEECQNDLHDGDQRTFRIVSEKTDLGSGLPGRVQVRYARGTFQKKEGLFTP